MGGRGRGLPCPHRPRRPGLLITPVPGAEGATTRCQQTPRPPSTPPLQLHSTQTHCLRRWVRMLLPHATGDPLHVPIEGSMRALQPRIHPLAAPCPWGALGMHLGTWRVPPPGWERLRGRVCAGISRWEARCSGSLRHPQRWHQPSSPGACWGFSTGIGLIPESASRASAPP